MLALVLVLDVCVTSAAIMSARLWHLPSLSLQHSAHETILRLQRKCIIMCFTTVWGQKSSGLIDHEFGSPNCEVILIVNLKCVALPMGIIEDSEKVVWFVEVVLFVRSAIRLYYHMCTHTHTHIHCLQCCADNELAMLFKYLFNDISF